MSSKQKYILIAAVLLTCLDIQTVAAAGASGPTIKCWKNNIGIRECGSIVPPEYSQKRIEVLNARGQVIDVIKPPKTPEELAKEREQERKRKADEDARNEQARQDKILLNSYTTERDLIIARDTNIKAAQAQLDIAMGNLKFQKNDLGDLQKRAGNYERSGKKPPEKLIKRIEEVKKQIEKKQRGIDRLKDEKESMEARYDKDLARFRKLKGRKSPDSSADRPPASATADPSTQAAKQ